jgi:predicted DNA-binding antitoxin AbrB/MazE fold protein
MITPLFKKLNLKEGMRIVVLNYPDSFNGELDSIKKGFEVSTTATKKIDFVLIFVTEQKEINKHFKAVHKKLIGDAILWFCYPKQTSKKYTCNFNRDTGWEALKLSGYETVRAVAIDEDWSALRFRKLENIKNFTRTKI